MNNNLIVVNSCLFGIVLAFSSPISAEEQNQALNLSVEDLLNVEVTSVAKKAQSLNDAPAAVFVISNEDINRSGATSIPDALRLAPGLDVAKISSNQWAVSSRGFNGRFANKLLVLVDGRNAYSRSFAGVYWENLDVMMEDIERIEVIRGPGASLWGANAVNGVINIITKHSSQTLGGLLTAGGGNLEQGFGSLRYGAKLGEETTARVYVKGFNRGQNTLESGGKAVDNWNKVQGGFRLDSQIDTQNSLTVQGDIYQANIDQLAYYPQVTSPYRGTETVENNNSGGNFLSRLQHTFSPTSDYSLQFYYDTYTHEESAYNDRRDTLDVDFQHRFTLLDWNEIVWGMNYRFGHDRIVGNQVQNGISIFTLNPVTVNDQVFSGFIQDEISLIDNELSLTVGSKFEHNDYSGFEIQPSAKIMWAPHHQHRLWASVSRAVRTPSRMEQTATFMSRIIPPHTQPLFSAFSGAAIVNANPDYDSETVIAYEAGYRTTFLKSVSLDITGFYNDYDNLRFPTQGTPFFNGQFLEVPFKFTNELHGETYGVEIATVWQMLDWWRWDINYSWLQTRLDESLGSPRTGISPEQRVSIRGALSPTEDIDLDFWFRFVDENFAVVTPGDSYVKAYVTLDLRAAWRPYQGIELSVVGQNLLSQGHLEYIAEIQTQPTLTDRSVYGKFSWSF